MTTDTNISWTASCTFERDWEAPAKVLRGKATFSISDDEMVTSTPIGRADIYYLAPFEFEDDEMALYGDTLSYSMWETLAWIQSIIGNGRMKASTHVDVMPVTKDALWRGVYVLDWIEIFEEYRGKGYGQTAFYNMLAAAGAEDSPVCFLAQKSAIDFWDTLKGLCISATEPTHGNSLRLIPHFHVPQSMISQ